MTHLDPEARRLVSLTRAARTPSAADKQRVRRRIALAAAGSLVTVAGADVAHATQGAAAVKAVGLVGPIKLYVVGAMIVLAGVTGYVLVPASREPDARSGAQPTTERPVAAEQPAPVTESAAPAVSSPPSPTGKRVLAGREVAKRSRGALPLRAASEGAELARELDLLHGAQTAWRQRDFGRTLSLLDQHAREYPKSELREERGGLRVLALCELGRRTEARRLAEALIRRAPRSPVLATIEESCAFQ